jgi:hypothetical protein
VEVPDATPTRYCPGWWEQAVKPVHAECWIRVRGRWERGIIAGWSRAPGHWEVAVLAAHQPSDWVGLGVFAYSEQSIRPRKGWDTPPE